MNLLYHVRYENTVAKMLINEFFVFSIWTKFAYFFVHYAHKFLCAKENRYMYIFKFPHVAEERKKNTEKTKKQLTRQMREAIIIWWNSVFVQRRCTHVWISEKYKICADLTVCHTCIIQRNSIFSTDIQSAKCKSLY